MASKSPKAFMTDTDVKIVSLVDKAANKKRFVIFKAADGGPEEDAVIVATEKAAAAPAATPVEKDCCLFEGPTSFAAAIAAQEAAEALETSRFEMEEYFYTLRCVLKTIVNSPTVADKKSALKRAIDEFGTATTALFAKVPVAKQAELFSEGNPMTTPSAPAPAAKPTSVAKAGGSGMSDIADGGQPDGQNRNYTPEAIEQIAKAKQRKEAAEREAVELAAKDKEDDDAFMKKKAEMKKAEDDYAAKKSERDKKKKELEKSAAEAAAIVKGDGISDNGPVQTPDHSLQGGGAQVEKAAAAAAEAAKSPVQKDNLGALGVTNPTTFQSDPQRLGVGSMPDNTPGAPVENFHSRYGVELDGSLGAREQMFFTSVMKGVEKIIDAKLDAVQKAVASEVEKKIAPIEKSQKELTQVSKMAGLSNAMDFDTSSERERVGVEKSEDKEWAGALDGFGSMRRKQG